MLIALNMLLIKPSHAIFCMLYLEES